MLLPLEVGHLKVTLEVKPLPEYANPKAACPGPQDASTGTRARDCCPLVSGPIWGPCGADKVARTLGAVLALPRFAGRAGRYGT